MPTATITRPALRYHGGKFKLAPWIVSHFGPHATYTEAYGGGGSVLLRKPRAVGEVYNDLDGDVVNLFRVLRDPLLSARLREHLRLTPYARDEFDAAYQVDSEPVARAVALVVRSFMGFGVAAHNADHKTGFCSTLAGGRVKAWAGYPDSLLAVTERLQGVLVEQRPAIDVLARFDSLTTLHYVDPPYVTNTRVSAARGGNNIYRFEMSEDEHRALADTLRHLKGMVVLSGYACDLYDQELFADWHRIERETHADGARPRTEVLWLNAYAAAKSNTPAFGVFAA